MAETNRQVICKVLMEKAEKDKDIVVLCSDSRGSASLTPFAEAYPSQFVEMGIAEQDLVSVAAGLASCGKKAWAASPASFLSARSYEQCKVDVAYNDSNVKLIGISGGVSYGALGMTHHSCQDIAAMTALPGMRVYLPSDRFLTRKLIEALAEDDQPAYVRVSRQATEDVYDENMTFTMDRANVPLCGHDVQIVACGDMVPNAVGAANILKEHGIQAGVIDMYCLKPFDEKTLLDAAAKSRLIVTVEEHDPFGGLGALVSQCISANHPMRVLQLSLPDAHLIAGTNKEIFKYYKLDAEGIAQQIAAVFS